MTDDADLIRDRRRRREAEGRRKLLLAVGVAGTGVLVAACGGLAVLLRRHQPVTVAVGSPGPSAAVAVGPGGVAVAVTPAPPAPATEPTEAEWADLLAHPWWRDQISRRAAERLVDELTTARTATTYFNRQGRSVLTVDDDSASLSLERNQHDRQALRQMTMEREDERLGLWKRLGEFKAARVFSGIGERASRTEALRAVWDALNHASFRPPQSPPR